MWTNKQHIMSRLAKRHTVYHVNFGHISPLEMWQQRRKTEGALDILRPGALLDVAVQEKDGVQVVDVLAPGMSRPPGHPLSIASAFDLRARLVRRFMRQQGLRDAIAWVYHPGYGMSAARLPHKLLVYDCVDEYSQFPEYKTDPTWLIERERALCGAADLVFATARPLWEIKRDLNPGNTHLVHNVGDAAHFSQALRQDTTIPDDIDRLPRPIIGFVGAVSAYKVNIPWLLHLARTHPEWSLAVVGPVGLSDPSTDVGQLRALPNVHLLGHRDYAQLPAYVKAFDVSVIPYQLNEYTRCVFPIKFFELLATGRPLVISPLPSLEDYFDAAEVAHNQEQFVERCEAALADPTSGADARVALAQKNDWEARVTRLMAHVEQKLT